MAKTLRDVWAAPLVIWGLLCLALTLTCFAAYLPLGSVNLAISLAIAAIKAGFIGWGFMRLSEGNALFRLAACTGPLWVFVMFLLIGADYVTR
jgi:cytochrome c oxidase subunit 4